MVEDAETHAEEDRKARELIDARNHAEAMVHTVRKTLTEAEDKVEAEEKERIESAISELEEAVKGDDAEEITGKTNALMEASHKLAERMYQEQADTATAGDDSGSAEGTVDGASGGDDVVDAEFEEVKDNKDT
jgi:molecular chaperone DnaK